jgi:uncharacterized protein YdhG (YjbR/CyaY superfamily)
MDTSIPDVDTYMEIQPAEVRVRLHAIRETIRATVPEAIESISYGMPAYKLNGKPLIYFAAFKNHIGFYATPEVHETFAGELLQYKRGKGSVQFPLNLPIPIDLIRQMVICKARMMASTKK